jgi:hypothetical protein
MNSVDAKKIESLVKDAHILKEEIAGLDGELERLRVLLTDITEKLQQDESCVLSAPVDREKIRDRFVSGQINEEEYHGELNRLVVAKNRRQELLAAQKSTDSSYSQKGHYRSSVQAQFGKIQGEIWKIITGEEIERSFEQLDSVICSAFMWFYRTSGREGDGRCINRLLEDHFTRRIAKMDVAYRTTLAPKLLKQYKICL